MENLNPDILPIKKEIELLAQEGKISLAYLFGSYARGEQTRDSDIDIAVYINAKAEEEMLKIEDRILMSSEKEIGLLRLEREDEDPEIVLDALAGLPLTEGDIELYYKIARASLHEAESMRRRTVYGPGGR